MNGGFAFQKMRDHDTPIVEHGTCGDARPIYRENPCPLCRYGNLVDCWLPGFICDLCDHILKKLDNDEWLVFKSDWTFIVVVYFDFEGKIIRKEKTQTTTYLQAENLYKTFEFVRLE